MGLISDDIPWLISGFAKDSQTLLAHVSYVVDPEKLKALSGTDWAFVLSPLQDSLYVILISVTLIVTFACFVACETLKPLQRSFQLMHNRLLTYSDFIPLTLRASFGMALIVAGNKQILLLPNVPGPEISTLEVVIGFCLVVGIMTRFSGFAALVIFIYGLTVSHYLLGTLESAAAAILIMAYGAKRPSTDDVLQVDIGGRAGDKLWTILRDWTGPLLRVALGSTLIWLAITEKFLNPRVSEAVVIDFKLENVIPVSSAMWVFSVGVIEFAVGIVLVIGFFTRTWSIIAFLVLTLSFFYFREEVVGHITFFGSLTVLIITGAGPCSVDALIAKRTRGVRGTCEPYRSNAIEMTIAPA